MNRDIVWIALLVSLKASLQVYTEPLADWTSSGYLARNATMSWAVQSRPSNRCSQKWSLLLLSNSVCHSRENVWVVTFNYIWRNTTQCTKPLHIHCLSVWTSKKYMRYVTESPFCKLSKEMHLQLSSQLQEGRGSPGLYWIRSPRVGKLPLKVSFIFTNIISLFSVALHLQALVSITS